MKTEADFIDISPLISSRIGVFPGDIAFERSLSMDFAKGDHLSLSSVRSTLHLGAHADAPNHYSATGQSIAQRDLALYMGRCLVVHASARPGERVKREHFSPVWRTAREWPARRILVRTGSFPNADHWNHDFCSLDPGLIEEWALAGIRLVGIDTPSVDPETSSTLETHQTLAKFDMAVLEGLLLGEVPEGLYCLMALPLRIEGADASPVRAVLFRNAALFE